MVTPPDRWCSDTAAAAIVDLRDEVDDPSRWQADPDNPLALARWVQAHPNRGMTAAQQAAEVLAVLQLRVAAWWTWERVELWALRRAVELGVDWRQVGEVLGVGSRQGVETRRARKEALLSPLHTPSEKAWRRYRRDRARGALDPRARWLDDHRAQLNHLADQLLAHRDQAADQEWLEELDADRRAGRWTAGAVTVLACAAMELDDVPAVQEVRAQVSRLVREWNRIAP